MKEIDELSSFLVWCIRTGIGIKVIYSFIKMMHGEEIEIHKARIEKAVLFLILAECIWQLKNIAIYYFG